MTIPRLSHEKANLMSPSTVGHVHPDTLEIQYSQRDDTGKFGQQLVRPVLEVAQTIVPEHDLRARLEVRTSISQPADR